MAFIIRDLQKLTTVTSSGGTAGFSNIIGGLDDASSITIFFTSSSITSATSNSVVQVSGWDPAEPNVPKNMTSSQFIASGLVTSSMTALVLTNISFRSFRLSSLVTTSSGTGEVIAFVSKQIQV